MGFLSVTEFKPDDVSPAFTENLPDAEAVNTDEPIKILSWNIGYAGLDRDADFFMDGGKMVNPVDEEHVRNNLAAIGEFIKAQDADINLLQEIDRKANRSKNINELEYFKENLNQSSAFAQNFVCRFVPYPLPPIGYVDAGVATFTDYASEYGAVRHSLPCPFSWPVRMANLKRCMLETRYRLENGRDLVIINLHLEAYDEGDGKEAQTKALIGLLESEYEKENYVIAGGDFNQTFPEAVKAFPVNDDSAWVPGTLENDILPENWNFVYDTETPSCRLLNKPYTDFEDMQHYILDGFIVSPNVEVVSVENADLEFANSDHNPVVMNVNLIYSKTQKLKLLRFLYQHFTAHKFLSFESSHLRISS